MNESSRPTLYELLLFLDSQLAECRELIGQVREDSLLLAPSGFLDVVEEIAINVSGFNHKNREVFGTLGSAPGAHFQVDTPK